MNRQQFSELVKDPQTLGEGTITELQDLLREYPYCQTAQILLALNLLRQNNQAYPAQLKKAVAYAGDRKKLKEFLEIKKEQHHAVSNDAPAVYITEPDEQSGGILQMPVATGSEQAGSAEPAILPAIPASTPATLAHPDAAVSPLQASISEPQQESYIEDSVISSEELALASPQAPSQEAVMKSTAVPLPSAARTSSASLEKMTREELLDIVRKRLTEINDENKGKRIKPEKVIPPEETGNGAPVLRAVAEPGISKDELIEKFIREEPQMSRPKKEFFSPTASSQKSNLDEEDIVSETLALLYAKQGNMQKAIHIYEKLSLRFSEKSRYFAAQIENLKGNNHQSL
ncbi:MAG: hypothetical protein WCI48_08300 [Bacteroidota bacterium]|jgi:hypothetical protein